MNTSPVRSVETLIEEWQNWYLSQRPTKEATSKKDILTDRNVQKKRRLSDLGKKPVLFPLDEIPMPKIQLDDGNVENVGNSSHGESDDENDPNKPIDLSQKTSIHPSSFPIVRKSEPRDTVLVKSLDSKNGDPAGGSILDAAPLKNESQGYTQSEKNGQKTGENSELLSESIVGIPCTKRSEKIERLERHSQEMHQAIDRKYRYHSMHQRNGNLRKSNIAVIKQNRFSIQQSFMVDNAPHYECKTRGESNRDRNKQESTKNTHVAFQADSSQPISSNELVDTNLATTDSILSILENRGDQVLQKYIPLMNINFSHYPEMVQPFVSKKRTLPLNHLEIVLRRRAIKKRANVESMSVLSPQNITSQLGAIELRDDTEESVGDTSLGLKLSILQGKVIVQSVTCLDDGRASPSQLCGLISPGDMIIAVDGLSMINGTIHDPVPMDAMFAVLKPLSQPIDENTGLFAREVRLRLVIGGGLPLLREQKEREDRKKKVMEERKKMGLGGKGGLMIDPVADIFGLGALMGVDQHTGMPLFQHDHLALHHHENSDSDEFLKPEVEKAEVEKISTLGPSARIQDQSEKMESIYIKQPSPMQSQISHQIAAERQWIRNRSISKFFTLDSEASCLLRLPTAPPSLPKDAQILSITPVESLKKRLEHGTKNLYHAKEILSNVERQERRLNHNSIEDPLEVASRACGIASVRTRTSLRRWHRGESVAFEDAQSSTTSSASIENHVDTNTLHSGESIEACDHSKLIDLAANNESWKRNVVKRLEKYAEDTEIESEEMNGNNHTCQFSREEKASSTFDTLLFGGDVTKILGKKKKSFALPPGEMTQLLYDLEEHLSCDLPYSILINDDASYVNDLEREVTFTKSRTPNIAKAIEFLINDALGIWLKSFRPLPWKQRRALWPLHQFESNSESGSMLSSQFDDGMSLSIASGSTTPRNVTEKRNLREVIEELELDSETRRETCTLVTFYLTQMFSLNNRNHTIPHLSIDEENKAEEFIDIYGSYLNIYKCLVWAGKVHSALLIKKLVRLAQYDPYHREAMKALAKAKVLLFYEPKMLSALHELLPSISIYSHSNSVDLNQLLVSAYPDLQPWCVKAVSIRGSTNFYFKYLSSLLHPEEGNDVAKRDRGIVKEWCSIISSSDESDPEIIQERDQLFLHIASPYDEYSVLYNRDLLSLMDVSFKLSKFKLALELANELISSSSFECDKLILSDILQRLHDIASIAIIDSNGRLDSSILRDVINIYTLLSPYMNDHLSDVSEILELLEICNCKSELSTSSKTIYSCVKIISESATPSTALKILSHLKFNDIEPSALASAIHTTLIRGAREGFDNEISSSLMRISHTREEGGSIIDENSIAWHIPIDETAQEDDDQFGGCIWSSIMDGSIVLSK